MRSNWPQKENSFA